ncbi:MoaD/ThiS family protein [Hufsiella ginkgonis]|uniref:MoaD/ThiS family protein n=1 Tax=Hufsiella ginkgonis TaxID=2695274 RepID=A0A7K1XZ17_9SPHI|nr:MoaD/ThiS family protein [Hufsiella ginkgonis]MXV16067.1 MoaD/ThiS family protein [Hufsiella ginkgonis]
MKISFFGQLTDIVSGSTIEIDAVSSTAALVEALNRRYPAMRQVSYAIAINKKIVNGNAEIVSDAEIALLPPFSGG